MDAFVEAILAGTDHAVEDVLVAPDCSWRADSKKVNFSTTPSVLAVAKCATTSLEIDPVDPTGPCIIEEKADDETTEEGDSELDAITTMAALPPKRRRRPA